jgi:uncharacterized membrane protein
VNTTLADAAAAYVDAVRAELADLPPDEVAEIVDDVADHLEQVVAELGDIVTPAALADRIGSPAAYAAELRAAAGFPAPTGGPRRGDRSRRAQRFLATWVIRIALAIGVTGTAISLVDGYWYPEFWLVAAMLVAVAGGGWLVLSGPSREPAEVLRELPDLARAERRYGLVASTAWGSATTEFGASLRPAWWVVRGWVAASVLIFFVGRDPAFPIDRSVGAVLVLAAAIVASVWWGRRSAAGTVEGWPRLAQLAGNALLAIAVPMVVFSIGQPTGYTYTHHEPVFDGFYHPDGSPIVNLFPYGPDGHLLENVRLYDQEGRAVDNVYGIEWDADCAGAADGRPGNVFPRPSVELDPVTGRCVEVEFAAPFGAGLRGTAPSSVVDGEHADG